MTKEDAFWNLIQATASKQKSSFYLDCGEGRDFETGTLKGEDYFGWLIPNNKEAEFSKEFKLGNVSDTWNDYLVFAIWKNNNGAITIEFKTYN